MAGRAVRSVADRTRAAAAAGATRQSGQRVGDLLWGGQVGDAGHPDRRLPGGGGERRGQTTEIRRWREIQAQDSPQAVPGGRLRVPRSAVGQQRSAIVVVGRIKDEIADRDGRRIADDGAGGGAGEVRGDGIGLALNERLQGCRPVDGRDARQLGWCRNWKTGSIGACGVVCAGVCTERPASGAASAPKPPYGSEAVDGGVTGTGLTGAAAGEGCGCSGFSAVTDCGLGPENVSTRTPPIRPTESAAPVATISRARRRGASGSARMCKPFRRVLQPLSGPPLAP